MLVRLSVSRFRDSAPARAHVELPANLLAQRPDLVRVNVAVGSVCAVDAAVVAQKCSTLIAVLLQVPLQDTRAVAEVVLHVEQVAPAPPPAARPGRHHLHQPARTHRAARCRDPVTFHQHDRHDHRQIEALAIRLLPRAARKSDARSCLGRRVAGAPSPPAGHARGTSAHTRRSSHRHHACYGVDC